MNCRDAEVNIYLYEELSSSERKQLNAHLEHCSACAHVLEKSRSIQDWRTRLPDVPPTSDEAALTRRIMNSVYDAQKEKRSVWVALASGSFNTPFRYGMVALSVFLLFTFMAEYSTSVFKPDTPYESAPESKMELNTASFHDAFLAARKQKDSPLFNKCISDCLYGSAADCSDCGKPTIQNQRP